MAYIGNNPDAIQTTIEITRFNGTGACTEFQIPQDVDDAKAIEVLVNSVQQDPDNSYTVTNGLITFTEAPSVGTNNVTVLRRTGITFTRTQIDAGDILPNAVTTVAIAE
jgi:predicted amidohydrolase